MLTSFWPLTNVATNTPPEKIAAAGADRIASLLALSFGSSDQKSAGGDLDGRPEPTRRRKVGEKLLEVVRRDRGECGSLASVQLVQRQSPPGVVLVQDLDARIPLGVADPQRKRLAVVPSCLHIAHRGRDVASGSAVRGVSFPPPTCLSLTGALLDVRRDQL